ncbi:hypothetical protein PACTADRAFT_23072, partial [Pachysolen tannophilus NRRL Y-2460]
KIFFVIWRKKTMKKNKTWDGDGLLILNQDGTGTFRCDLTGGENYREQCRSLGKVNLEGLVKIGNYEMEVDYEITNTDELAKYQRYLQSHSSSNTADPAINLPKFKQVITANTLSRPPKEKRPPLYNPNAEEALVMKRPPNEPESDVVDVVVDPCLSKHLRPHQREGVLFLYECIMGFRDHGGNGALLADEMGLGKTLMTITLIWTLLRQSPYASQSPVAKRVLVVCPVTLIGNWKKEFKKWLGMNKISVLTINGSNNAKADKANIKSFGRTRVYQVLILGYEKVLTMADELETVDFDLLVCDEGHRLKSSQNKVLKVLNTLDIEKRILLTGTPIQNDLTEFYNIINFVNPGIFGSFDKFQRNFINPILRAREVNCKNKQVIEMGNEKSDELIQITRTFILRRTNTVISKFLPPRTDLVLFVPPTKLQLSLFNAVLDSQMFNKTIQKNNFSDSLSLITVFRKICNSPALVNEDDIFTKISGNDSGRKYDLSKKVASGKMKIVVKLLNSIRDLGSNEKVVLISNFTQTLDLLQTILDAHNMSYLRLDGSTQSKVRDKVVNDFNTSSSASSFVFLLSAKSGGCGLNLIGASRLILFDNDWNPSVDLQAMARIHRDGQKRPVFVYRLLTSGAIDEKIFQRQLMKNNLSDKFLDDKSSSKNDLFEYSDLRDLFTVDADIKSNTHSLLECKCTGTGEEVEGSEPVESEEEEKEELEDKSNDAKPDWISALDFKQVSQEPIKKKNAIKSLQDYKHIDPEVCSEFIAYDEVLENIIRK